MKPINQVEIDRERLSNIIQKLREDIDYYELQSTLAKETLERAYLELEHLQGK